MSSPIDNVQFASLAVRRNLDGAQYHDARGSIYSGPDMGHIVEISDPEITRPVTEFPFEAVQQRLDLIYQATADVEAIAAEYDIVPQPECTCDICQFPSQTPSAAMALLRGMVPIDHVGPLPY